MDDLISRQIIKAQMMKYGFRAPDMTVTEFVEDCLPSAQQDCSDCIKHGGDWDCDHVHCHKGESAQPEQRWIPVKSRPMDDEERKEWSEKVGYELEGDDALIYTSQLPEDGQECIVCTKWGNVFIDTFQNDPDYGCAFEEHGDMDGITAWMPLPKAWKGEKDE